jgi:8-oxo-dGTP diphosphatase
MPSFPSPVQVVCALIFKEGRVLIAKRPPDKRLGGFWEFPGGKIDPGEIAETALHRELQEELACSVQILRSLSPIEHRYPWCDVHMAPFVCQLSPQSPLPVALEHTDLAWVAWQDLPQYDLAPADIPLLSGFDPTDLTHNAQSNQSQL